MKAYLDSDQFRLYDLIWKRAVASQMVPAVFDTVAVSLVPAAEPGAGHVLRANGSILVDPGFMAAYREGKDEKSDDDSDRILPPLEEGQAVALKAIRPEQHFTEPPPRYSEASLVKALEEFGIGRPSTYASIISTLQNREYVEMDRRRFIPTDMGRVVNRFLTNHFTRYVDYDFTAELEDELDAISRGEETMVPVLDRFWQPFEELVRDKETSVSREEVVQARVLGEDPKSGRPISVRMGRYGPFVQIGSRDDEDKPRFAGLRPGQKMDLIDLESALALFELPRELGETPEGEPVSANIGRFGPYVKYGSKFVSLKGDDDPYSVTLERALELIREKKIADANRLIRDFPDEGIQVLNGRYGPYITNGEKNARVPKDRDPKTLELAECQELLEKAPARGRGKKKAAKKKTAAKKKPAAKKKAAAKKKPARKKKAAGKNASAGKSAAGASKKTPAAADDSGGHPPRGEAGPAARH